MGWFATLSLLPLLPFLAFASLGPSIAQYPSSTVVLDLGPETHHRELILRLDVEEAEDDCSTSNLFVDGQALGGYPRYGVLDLASGGPSINASWAFDCLDPVIEGAPRSQLMKFEVHSLEGVDVDGVFFTVKFRQVLPLEIRHVEGTVLRTSRQEVVSYEDRDDDDDDNADNDAASPDEARDEDLRIAALKARLALLRSQRTAIDDEIKKTSLEISEVESACGVCDGRVGCFFRSLIQKLMGSDHPPSRCSSSSSAEESQVDHNEEVGSASVETNFEEPPPSYEEVVGGETANETTEHVEEPSQPSHAADGLFAFISHQTAFPFGLVLLLATLPLTAILILTIWKCCRTKRTDALSAPSGCLARRRARRNNREKRHAAIQRRKELFLTGVRHCIETIRNINISASNADDAEKRVGRVEREAVRRTAFTPSAGHISTTVQDPGHEPEAELGDRHQHQRPKQQRDDPARTRSNSELSTTMEQDLAQFREAVDLVDNIVTHTRVSTDTRAGANTEASTFVRSALRRHEAQRALIERHVRVHGLQSRWSACSPPPSPTGSGRTASIYSILPEYESADEGLPAYAPVDPSITAAAALVTDGFQYTAVSGR